MVKKYYVLFVANYNFVKNAHGRKLTANANGREEFSLKEAKKIAKLLKDRGDKAIEIKELK